jgi:signal transduction histidine kinase
MLINGDAGKINDEQKQYLEEIYKGNQRMVDLVNSLLNVSRLELGTFEIKPESAALCPIVKDVLEEMQHLIEIKKLKVDTECKVGKNIPKVDKKLFRIIIQNLISNAVKYTPSGGSIKVVIDYNKDNPKSTYVLTVSDTGYGIPKSQQDKIFTKLFRADNVRAMDTEGTGLGLYIIKSIMDESGGKISFVSREKKGSTFKIELPKSGMKQKKGEKSLE